MRQTDTQKVAEFARVSSDLRTPGYAFHFASEYRERGWSVIPLQGKKPVLRSWKEFQSRRAAEAELRNWFSGSHNDTNIGIVTGPVSGLVVVDCDTPQDVEFWTKKHPLSPLTVETGGGGLHVYYQMPSVPVTNHAKILGRSIDIRGEGGYVVGPPSRHPQTGKAYAWQCNGDFSLECVPTFDCAWLGLDQDTTSDRCAVKIKNGPSYIRTITAVSGEGGHNATFRAAYRLRDAGLSPEEALVELLAWNETNAEPPWSARELLHKVQSVYHRGGRSRNFGQDK